MEVGVGGIKFEGLSVVLIGELVSIFSGGNEISIDEGQVLPESGVVGLKLDGGFGFGNGLLDERGDLLLVFIGKVFLLRDTGSKFKVNLRKRGVIGGDGRHQFNGFKMVFVSGFGILFG